MAKAALEQPPIIILLRPQMGENIGASARAMKNCGVAELRLVNPRDGWPNPLAIPMAASGADILDDVAVFDDLGAALHDVTLAFATTARLRDLVKPTIDPRTAAMMTVQRSACSLPSADHTTNGRIAYFFGAERSGMDNDEAVMADYIVCADLNPAFSSLNLAQAVLMMCWEWRMAALSEMPQTDNKQALEFNDEFNDLASLKERDFFFQRFETMLETKGFFATKEMAPIVNRNMRAFFTRGQPTKQELQTWHGILSMLMREEGS